MGAAASEQLPAPPSPTRTCSGGLDHRSARSLGKADTTSRHCSLDSKLQSMKLPGKF